MTIYLASIVVAFLIEILHVLSVDKEIKNMGYKWSKKEKNIFQTILDFLQILLINSIPVLNIAVIIAIAFKSKEIKESTINEYIKEGTIIEKTTMKPEEQEEFQQQLSKVIVYNTHNELTREEKIKFLKQEYARLTGEELEDNIIKKDRQNQKTKSFI